MIPSARRRRQSGQEIMEFSVMYAAVILPLTFMVIFVAEQLWIWHSVVDFTRQGAQYAATRCYTGDGSNVVSWMESHVPAMIDQAQFQSGDAGISVQYFTINPDGSSAPPNADCPSCIPDSVSVSITNYQFLRFAAYLRLPPVTMPPFTTNLPMESGGYQDATGVCVQ